MARSRNIKTSFPQNEHIIDYYITLCEQHERDGDFSAAKYYLSRIWHERRNSPKA